MQLFDLTTTTNEDGSQIVSVAGRISDHREIEKQKEWITFQVAIDAPTVRNGALLRAEALKPIRDTLDRLIQQYDSLGRER